ncbi:Dolichol-phosphate mannosyltransferase subunit 3 [Ascosphaera apis ARSEF 7405]|uniref:Dolichol-phosphate mannosyltransferase subunit 3 n=1 Tax=Ascosphaera apis ARSEF 7405 TaxID=392613 RepID=A0A168DWI5_9EURO|nr:Dolichol-phosphate mannosyltransferase subunit 3 [Ascosphaera apis ARSEF 7405]
MTRATQFFSIALLVSSLYLALYLGLVPVPATVQNEIIPVLPIYFVVALGSYLLFRLGWGVFTFNDCPEAYESLQKEIVQAKTELRALKVDVD